MNLTELHIISAEKFIMDLMDKNKGWLEICYDAWGKRDLVVAVASLEVEAAEMENEDDVIIDGDIEDALNVILDQLEQDDRDAMEIQREESMMRGW